MISFLLDEGVVTVGALSGIFTTALLNSFKANIVDPGIERLCPSHKLDSQSAPPSSSSSSPISQDKSNFANMFPLPMGTPTGGPKDLIKWQTFLKDFITWLIIMFCLYIFWKTVIHPIKRAK